MPNIVKQMMMRELNEELKDADGLLVVAMSGLTVKETEDLRVKLAEASVPLRMVPNRLARLALKDRGLDPPEGLFKGNVGISWGGPEAAIHAAKVMKGSPARKDGRLAYLGGLLEGNFLSATDAASMAEMPTRDQLRSSILGCLSGPARGLVVCLAGNGSGLARVLQARIDKGGGVAEAPAEPTPEGAPAAEG
jgi:large subunit ribosomal protein L10